MKDPETSVGTIDLIKAVASQLIVLHHFVIYGPMSGAVRSIAADLMDWLAADARLAVQAFLVMGGFLAAKSLIPSPGSASSRLMQAGLLPLLLARYARLALPYVLAVALSIVCAAVARGLIADPDAPAAPTLGQFIAHVFLLQDLLDVPALSTGVWYIAIDFQLYALFVLILWSVGHFAALLNIQSGILMVKVCVGLMVASLFWLNRDSSLDEWAPYFFGSYGLGIMAQWARQSSRKPVWLIALISIVAVALVLDWRSRIAVAGVMALLLAVAPGSIPLPSNILRNMVARLGKISYSLFLVHYPIVMCTGAVVAWLWADDQSMNALGLVTAWLLSLFVAGVMHEFVELRALSAWRWLGKGQRVPQGKLQPNRRPAGLATELQG